MDRVLMIKPRGYKWGAVAASDIAELQQIAEKRKKIVVFFNYRKITATQISESTEELQMGAMTAPELISSCSLMGSTSDKKQPALSVRPEDLIQLEPTSSAVNFQKPYIFQKHSAFNAASTPFSSSS